MTDMFDQPSLTPESAGVWITVSELARRRNITRQTALERVTRLEKDGLLETRRDGRSRLVEMATFDRLVGQTGNAYREQGAETRRATEPGPLQPSAALRDAQSERAQYEAKLKALDLAERTGQLIPLRGEHGIETVLIKVTEAIIRDLGAPLNWVSEILETVRDGEPALRRLLRRKILEQRHSISSRLAAMAGEASEGETSGVIADIELGGDE